MVKEDQTSELSYHHDNKLMMKQVEDPKASEDVEMASEQEDPSTRHQDTQAEDPSVDAVMGLRVTLENLRQQIARAVVAGATQEDLLKLQERAVNIQNCIKFLDEVKRFVSLLIHLPMMQLLVLVSQVEILTLAWTILSLRISQYGSGVVTSGERMLTSMTLWKTCLILFL